MKRLKIKVVCLLLVAMVFTGCGTLKVKAPASVVNESMFVKVESGDVYDIVYHKDTKVMYVVSMYAYNYGNFTLLVDADGKPLLWEGEDE